MVTSPAGIQSAAVPDSNWSSAPAVTSESATSSDNELGGVAEGSMQRLTLPATPLFGTDGIRGRVGDLLSVPLALQVGFGRVKCCRGSLLFQDQSLWGRTLETPAIC